MWRVVFAGASLALMNHLIIPTESAGTEPLGVIDEVVQVQHQESVGRPSFSGVPGGEEARTLPFEAFPASNSALSRPSTRILPGGEEEEAAGEGQDFAGKLKGTTHSLEYEGLRADEASADPLVQELEKARKQVRGAKRRLLIALIFLLSVSLAITTFVQLALPGSWEDFTNIFREETISDVVIVVEDFISDHATSKWKSAPLVLLIFLLLYSGFYFIHKTVAFSYALASLGILRQRQTSPQPKQERKEPGAVQDAPPSVSSD